MNSNDLFEFNQISKSEATLSRCTVHIGGIASRPFGKDGKFNFSNGPNGRSCGVAIWVANHSKCQVIDEMHEHEGRIISILAQIGNINVVNSYAPNNGRERVIFLRDMSNYLFTNVVLF